MAFIKNKANLPASQEALKQPQECKSLVLKLSWADQTARRWAARDLADYPDATGELVDRLKQETDVSVREMILTSLARLKNEVAVAGLVECLRSENAALRNEAIEVMKQLPEEVAPIMQDLLNDLDPDVRIFAVNILESLRRPEVESWLVKVIEHDTHVNVCAAAVDLLGEVGSMDSREALLGLKRRFPQEPYILFAANLALRRIDEA